MGSIQSGAWLRYKAVSTACPSPNRRQTTRADRMLHKVFSIQIQCKEDMAKLEEALVRLLGGEQSKCSLVRSQEFINIRLRALYNRGPAERIEVYGERVKICLDVDKTAEIYLMELGLDAVPALLGKRPCPDDPEPHPPHASYFDQDCEDE